jgi:hypothetical protein
MNLLVDVDCDDKARLLEGVDGGTKFGTVPIPSSGNREETESPDYRYNCGIGEPESKIRV